MIHNHVLYYIATNLKVNPFIKKITIQKGEL